MFAAYAHRWQKAALRGPEIGVNFHILFQSVINITTQLGRRDMKLFSTVLFILFYWDWIKNTQEIRQWKSLKLDQLTYTERSREHSGLPNNSNSPYGLCGRKATLNWTDPLCSRPLPVHSFACSYWLITLSSCMIQLLITPRLLVMNSSWPQLEKNGGGDSSVVRAPDSWLKGRGFESLLEWRENFLLQGRLSVLTLISVSVPPPCYHSST